MFLNVLANFFKECPALSDRKISLNYPAAISEASLISLDENVIFREYTDGSALYQTVFKLVLKEPFAKSTDFSSFYSAFSDWIASVDRPSSLPLLGGGFSPVSLSILKSGAVKNVSPSGAEFEVICRFLYFR